MKNQWKKIFFPQDPKKSWVTGSRCRKWICSSNISTWERVAVHGCSWLFTHPVPRKPSQNRWNCWTYGYVICLRITSLKKHMDFVSFLKTYRFGFPENQPSLAAPDQMFCREGGLIGCAQTWAWISGLNCLMPLHLKKGEVSNDMIWFCTSQQPWKFRNSKKTGVIVWHQPKQGVLWRAHPSKCPYICNCLIPPEVVGPI